jgi:hypothetical protein
MAELEVLSQEFKKLGLELAAYELDLSDDDEREAICTTTGVTISQKEKIIKDAIWRAEYDECNRRERDKYLMASQFIDNQAYSMMSQGSKDLELIETYGLDLFLEVQCDIFRQAIRNRRKKYNDETDRAVELFGEYTCLEELTDTQHAMVNPRNNPMVDALKFKRRAVLDKSTMIKDSMRPKEAPKFLKKPTIRKPSPPREPIPSQLLDSQGYYNPIYEQKS